MSGLLATTMTMIAILSVVVAAALALVLWPLLRRPPSSARAAKPRPASTASRWSSRAIAAAIAGALPILAFLGYAMIELTAPPPRPGETAAPRPPTARRPLAATDRDPPHDIHEAVAKLAERLAREPLDAEGWAMLARSYAQLGQLEAAAQADRRANALRQDGPLALSREAEDLVVAAKGVVTPEARTLFEGVLQAAPKDPRTRFFLGLARTQAGEHRAAVEAWISLEADAPAEAQWLPGLRDQIIAVAEIAGIDAGELATLRASAARAATPTR